MEKVIFITFFSMISIGCASFRNPIQNVGIIKPINETNITNKKMLIINNFNDYDVMTAERLDLRDQYLYTYSTKNLYTAATVLNDNKEEKIEYTDYDYILYNKLYISKNEYPLKNRVIDCFLFIWRDKRTLYLSSTFKDLKTNKETSYIAGDTYIEMGLLFVPILPLFGKTNKEVKKEAFDNLNINIFNKIYSDSIAK